MTNPIRSGSRLTVLPAGRWATPRDISAPTVIFVHGFTANGSYFTELSEWFRNWGFSTLSFEYDSYEGVDVAARHLTERIRPLQKQLRSGFVIVAHSLGGLVVRQFVREFSQTPFADGLKGMCTLGTPHAGTLYDMTFLSYLTSWSDWLTGFNPYFRLPTCRTALQLTRKDEESFIDRLNDLDVQQPHDVPVLSVSGKKPYLEVGNAWLSNNVANRYIQALLSSPNDGLVPEASSDITQVLGNRPGLTHRRDYSDYANTNHTYLVRNQAIAQLAVEWCLERLSVIVP